MRQPASTRDILMTCSLAGGAGGVQLVFQDLIRWFERSGRHVHVIYPSPLATLRPREQPDASGRPAIYMPLPGLVRENPFVSVPLLLAFMPLAVLRVWRLLRQRRIAVVNCHFLDPYFIHLVIAARLHGARAVVSVHGADLDRYPVAGWSTRLLLRLVMKGAHDVVACSSALARQAAELFPEARGKVTFVHNAIDPERYVPLPEQIEHTAGLPTPFVLCVCRHVPKKGVDTLLHAFSSMLTTLPDVTLVLVGDGPLLAEHRALAARLGIMHRVRFMGELDHARVAPLFARCALYVLPSRIEPFGIVLLEAGYYARPIVATRVGGVPEIITDQVDGLLVEPDDPPALARQMTALLRDPARGERYGRRARETVIRRFLWKDRSAAYLDVFDGRGNTGLGAEAATPALSV
jgi:glycosyltransferase involved in cell wall biosynthesis